MPPLRYRFFLTETKEMSPVWSLDEVDGHLPRMTREKDGIKAQLDLIKPYIWASVIPLKSTGMQARDDKEVFEDDVIRIGTEGSNITGRVRWMDEYVGFGVED